MSPGDAAASRRAGRTRLTFPAVAGAPVVRPVRAAVARFATVTWTPVDVAIAHPAGGADEAAAAVLAFHERAVEALAIEAELAAIEPGAASDIRYSYRIRPQHRAQWSRQLAVLERLAGLRLRLARLMSRSADPPAELTERGERLFEELGEAAALADRLERIDIRLEALEDLYEGAVDRINDFLGWRHGHILEVLIILLLLAEVVLLLLKASPGH